MCEDSTAEITTGCCGRLISLALVAAADWARTS